MDTCGVNAAATVARRCMSSRSRATSRGRASMSGAAASAAPSVMPGRTPAAWACGIRIDDALVVIFGIDHRRAAGGGAAAWTPARASDELRHMRGDPQLARLEPERRLISWTFCGPLGGGDAGRTRKTDGVALDPGSGRFGKLQSIGTRVHDGLSCRGRGPGELDGLTAAAAALEQGHARAVPARLPSGLEHHPQHRRRG